MHILFATPETAPYTVTENGLGQRCAQLAEAITTFKPGNFPENITNPEIDPLTIPNPVTSLSVVAPLHSGINPDAERLARRLTPLKVPFNGGTEEVFIYEGRTPQRVRLFLLSHELFEVDDIYSHGRAERFALFARAVVSFCESFPLPVDVVHCHGWATGLIPAYLDAFGQDGPLAEVLTLFDAQDIDGHKGFPQKLSRYIGLPNDYLTDDALLLDNRLNYAQAGILFADFISTGSDSLNEALVAEDSDHPLAEAFADREEDLFGALDGIQVEEWNPANDSLIAVNFDIEGLNGKRRNKADVQHIFGLPMRPMVPLLAFTSGLDKARGLDVLISAVGNMLEDGASLQLVVMADGQDDQLKSKLVRLKEAFPRAVGLHYGHDEALLHRILAGCDLMVMPDRQPSTALQPLRALRYGTIPVAHSAGAFKDIVTEWDGTGKAPVGMAAGITYKDHNAQALSGAIERATELMKLPRQWRPLQEHAMKQDFSWAATANRFVALYEDLTYEEEDDDA